MGKAFEPEQRFEERDESDIIFNVDFMEITEEYLLFQDLWRSNDYKDLKN